MNAKIHKLLYEWGVQPHLVGFDYLAKAVELVLEDPKRLHLITKDLYPSIAKAFGSTSSRVERGIRHAVCNALDNMGPAQIRSHFGRTIRPNGAVPSSMFIAALVHTYNSMGDV